MSVSYLSLVLMIALSLQTIFSCLLVCFGLFFCWKPGMLCRATDTEVIRVCNNLDRSWAVFEICYCYSFLWGLSLLWTTETSESSGDLVYVFPFGFGSVLCMIPRKDPISLATFPAAIHCCYYHQRLVVRCGGRNCYLMFWFSVFELDGGPVSQECGLHKHVCCSRTRAFLFLSSLRRCILVSSSMVLRPFSVQIKNSLSVPSTSTKNKQKD